MTKHNQTEFIRKRIAVLESTKTKAQKRLEKAPVGYLKISSRKNAVWYYHVTDSSNRAGTYLDKEQRELVKRLAQKAYDRKVLRAAEQELRAWNALAMYFPDKTVEEVYETLSPARQSLVVPVRPSDEVFQKEWEAYEYEPGEFRPDQPVFMTARGERVRSKSEMLIANLLFRLGIPYRYECPLEVLVDGRTRYWRPDFTLLDVRNRKEVYLEHLGMLDDPEEARNYSRSAFWKMKVYEENGIYEGKNMIYSFETSQAPLDMVYLEMKVRRTLGLPKMGAR